MGFYGKIYEQAVDLFSRLKFKNTKNETCIQDSSLNDELVIVANGGETMATIEAGNKWIQFTRTDDLSCKIYHKGSAASEGTKETFIVVKDSDEEIADKIVFNDVITVQYPITDATGHIIGYEEKQYRMMTDIGELKDKMDTLEKNIAAVEEVANNASGVAYDAANLADEAKTMAQSAIDAVDSANEAATKATEAATKATEATKEAIEAVGETLATLDDQDKTLTELSRQLIDLSGRVAALESNI